MKALVITLSMVVVFLPWIVFLVILFNRAVENYRRWKRSGRAMNENDLGIIRLVYVTLMVWVWLLGW